jgi:hypothetical protein
LFVFCVNPLLTLSLLHFPALASMCIHFMRILLTTDAHHLCRLFPCICYWIHEWFSVEHEVIKYNSWQYATLSSIHLIVYSDYIVGDGLISSNFKLKCWIGSDASHLQCSHHITKIDRLDTNVALNYDLALYPYPWKLILHKRNFTVFLCLTRLIYIKSSSWTVFHGLLATGPGLECIYRDIHLHT